MTIGNARPAMAEKPRAVLARLDTIRNRFRSRSSSGSRCPACSTPGPRCDACPARPADRPHERSAPPRCRRTAPQVSYCPGPSAPCRPVLRLAHALSLLLDVRRNRAGVGLVSLRLRRVRMRPQSRGRPAQPQCRRPLPRPATSPACPAPCRPPLAPIRSLRRPARSACGRSPLRLCSAHLCVRKRRVAVAAALSGPARPRRLSRTKYSASQHRRGRKTVERTAVRNADQRTSSAEQTGALCDDAERDQRRGNTSSPPRRAPTATTIVAPQSSAICSAAVTGSPPYRRSRGPRFTAAALSVVDFARASFACCNCASAVVTACRADSSARCPQAVAESRALAPPCCNWPPPAASFDPRAQRGRSAALKQWC